MGTMRAIVAEKLGWRDGCELREIPVPEIAPREVLVDVQARGVNFADLLMLNGGYQSTPALPFIPGMEAAGVVVAAGPEVRKLRVGDRVSCHVPSGAFAEMLAANEAHCHALPVGVSFDNAAAMGMACETAYLALHDRARVCANEVVLVNGASGGVGLAAIEIAKAAGAVVLAGVTTPHKQDVAISAGADGIIDLSVSDLSAGLREQVYRRTNSRGVDIVIDPIGGEVYEASLRALARRGRIVSVGFACGRIPVIKANYLLLKTIEASGLQSAQVRNLEPHLAHIVHTRLMDLAQHGLLRPQIQGRYALADFRDALAVIDERKIRGRILLC